MFPELWTLEAFFRFDNCTQEIVLSMFWNLGWDVSAVRFSSLNGLNLHAWNHESMHVRIISSTQSKVHAARKSKIPIFRLPRWRKILKTGRTGLQIRKTEFYFDFAFLSYKIHSTYDMLLLSLSASELLLLRSTFSFSISCSVRHLPVNESIFYTAEIIKDNYFQVREKSWKHCLHGPF